jgi:heterodisulfide reductase subunit A
VDVARVVEAAQKMPMVVIASDNKYTCSEPGQASIRQAIVSNKLNRVVIAACSPRMHEPTFRKAVSAAGLNPYLLEIANIREQCSWVHSHDREKATAKAIELVKMAVAKVIRHEPLYPREVPVTKRALVIGGGITGIQAALDIANAGHEVVLLEQEPSIGGRMAQLDKTFPTLDCSACILTPKMVDVANHPKIRLLTYAEIKEVRGFVGNFKVEITQKARKVDYSNVRVAVPAGRNAPKKPHPNSTWDWENAPVFTFLSPRRCRPNRS